MNSPRRSLRCRTVNPVQKPPTFVQQTKTQKRPREEDEGPPPREPSHAVKRTRTSAVTVDGLVGSKTIDSKQIAFLNLEFPAASAEQANTSFPTTDQRKSHKALPPCETSCLRNSNAASALPSLDNVSMCLLICSGRYSMTFSLEIFSVWHDEQIHYMSILPLQPQQVDQQDSHSDHHREGQGVTTLR